MDEVEYVAGNTHTSTNRHCVRKHIRGSDTTDRFKKLTLTLSKHLEKNKGTMYVTWHPIITSSLENSSLGMPGSKRCNIKDNLIYICANYELCKHIFAVQMELYTEQEIVTKYGIDVNDFILITNNMDCLNIHLPLYYIADNVDDTHKTLYNKIFSHLVFVDMIKLNGYIEFRDMMRLYEKQKHT